MNSGMTVVDMNPDPNDTPLISAIKYSWSKQQKRWYKPWSWFRKQPAFDFDNELLSEPQFTLGSFCDAFENASPDSARGVNVSLMTALSKDPIDAEYTAKIQQDGNQFQITLYSGGTPILAMYAPAWKPVVLMGSGE